ncbi:unnamed protein product [Sympodiomycopsis kandeliae]
MPSTVAPQPIGSNLPLISSLPKVSFRRISDEEAAAFSQQAGAIDQQLINFGFNDGSPFTQPDHYMRFVEPIEADLKKQVEYDMDEQDKEWLDALNSDRRKEQLDTITYEIFEVIIDRLEKEWFDLMRRVPPRPQPAAIGPDGEPVSNNEDTECAICDDGECENSNAIVFCDGCNLAVHQDCYGIPYIPEGQWLCRKCTVSPDRAVTCILCPNEGGAFKQTTHGKWAHLMCAMWIPETGVSNPVYMEPIDSVERIPKARWKLQCYLCRHRHGACIQCENKSCFTAFHVTCARKAGLLIKAERQRASHGHHNDHANDDSDDDDEGEPLQAMCHKHIPKHLRQQRATQFAALESSGINGRTSSNQFDDEDSSTRGSTPILSHPASKPVSRKITIRRGPNGSISAISTPASPTKSARAYKKSYRAGPPLVPTYVINKVLDYVSKVRIRKKPELMIHIAKFWSLKREARRGAPLLKRLHLEPWTANAVPKEQNEADRLKKLQFMMLLREDLERLRMLAELVRKREREKLRQMDTIRTSLLHRVLFPFHGVLRETLDKIIGLDRLNLFLSPVSRTEVPDYYDIIKHPMTWATISARVDEQQYTTVDAFADDVQRVLTNAIIYNKPETPFHRTALKLRKAIEPLLAQLAQIKEAHHVKEDPSSNHSNDDPPQESAALDNISLANGHASRDLHLEPPAHVMRALDNYTCEERQRTTAEDDSEWEEKAPNNLIEDLFRQSNVIARPSPAPSPEPETQTESVAEQQTDAAAAELASASKVAEASAAVGVNGGASSNGDKKRGAEEAGLHDQDEVPAPKRQKSSEGTQVGQVESDDKVDKELPLTKPRQNSSSSSSSSSTKHSRADSQSRTRGRSSTAGEPDLQVEQLDDWDTFKRFEEGWILPEGSRRVRRLTASHHPTSTSSGSSGASAASSSSRSAQDQSLSGSRGRIKGRVSMPILPSSSASASGSRDAAKSKASASSVTFSSDVGDESTGKLSVNQEEDGSDLSDVPSEAEGSGKNSRASASVKRTRPKTGDGQNQAPGAGPGASAATQKRGLHGQFIRKNQSEKEPRARHGNSDGTSKPVKSSGRRSQSSTDHNPNNKAVETPQKSARAGSRERHGKVKVPPKAASGDEGDDNVEHGRSPSSSSSRKAKSSASSSSTRSTSSVTSHTAKDFPSGTLVWAKMYSYPYFPAEILSPTSSIVPEAVFNSKEPLPSSAPKGSAMHLVRFFDQTRSFGWIPTSHIRFLFEDDELDEKMKAAAKGKHSPGVRKAWHKAQLAAAGELEED